MGTAGGVPDPIGAVTITVRDFTNNPLAGIPVTLDFGGCRDIRLALSQAPGVTLDCAKSTVTAITNGSGVATFTVLGASNAGMCGADSMGGGLNAVHVCAAGVPIGNTSAAVWDLDGALSGDGVFVTDFFAAQRGVGFITLGHPYQARYDYNHSGSVSAQDIAVIGTAVRNSVLGTGGSRDGSGGAGYCGVRTTSFTCP